MEQKEKNQPKKSRHRKKQLYKNILQQMEFYFSDSNLAKDRFLSQLISVDPFVDLEIFLKFNKLRKLTESIEDIQKAVSKSEFLELSEDKTKICRKTPFVVKEDVDDCTIYVERLNSDATHEWLTTLFSEFGKVTYVSLPKYKNNGMVKGFAFIEFEDTESVEKTVQFFEKIGCKIPAHMEPENLCSIITYEGDKNEEQNSDHNKKNNTEVKDENHSIKRSHSEVEEENENTKNKKVKFEENVDLKPESGEVETEVKTKKKKNKNKNNIQELGLQILTKKEWKKMRSNYLNLQRKKMKELKNYLNKQKYGRNKDNSKSNNQTVDNVKHKPSLETPLEISKIDFKSGLIVKINLAESCQSAKTLKSELKTLNPDIQYVDVANECEEVYLRFSDSEQAQKFCSSDFNGKCHLLEGDEEKKYWDKILADRKNKLTKNSKRQRGRDKLLEKAEKINAQHIRFDDL